MIAKFLIISFILLPSPVFSWFTPKKWLHCKCDFNSTKSYSSCISQPFFGSRIQYYWMYHNQEQNDYSFRYLLEKTCRLDISEYLQQLRRWLNIVRFFSVRDINKVEHLGIDISNISVIFIYTVFIFMFSILRSYK